MDFIDDFIQEYKNNPCLWNINSANFKNRTKRQEAYMKLIEVAAQHGEHYNIERTKQKINNLRCAFRHQLKKYIELKNKGEKEDLFCPKRRYFESLMFLKDVESPDTKADGTVNLRETKNLRYREKTQKSQDNSNKDNESNNEISIISDQLIEVDKNKRDNNSKTTSSNIDASDVLYSLVAELETSDHNVSFGKESTDRDTNEYEKQQPQQLNNKIHNSSNRRKRSLSLSSQLSNDTEMLTHKSIKVDCSSLDIEKLISMTYKSVNDMDDQFTSLGKIIAYKLRTMDSTQAIYAERMIADILYQGQLKLLTPLSINSRDKSND